MKKNLGLSASILLLGLAAYSLSVLLFGVIWLVATTSRSLSADLLMPVVLLCLVLGGIVLCGINYKRFRIGRFNSDIFTTIYLFLVFMLSFTVNNNLILDYHFFNEWFPLIWPLINKLSINGIGIYEVCLFLATLCCGFTIGEDKNKKYYE